MKANLKLVDGLAMVGKSSSNHWIPMDGPEEIGGFSAGTRPMELILIGLGGCTAMDVISILRKKRIQVDDFEIELKADRADEHPRVFTKIDETMIAYPTGGDIGMIFTKNFCHK